MIKITVTGKLYPAVSFHFLALLKWGGKKKSVVRDLGWEGVGMATGYPVRPGSCTV